MMKSRAAMPRQKVPESARVITCPATSTQTCKFKGGSTNIENRSSHQHCLRCGLSHHSITFTNSHLECFPSDPEAVFPVREEAADALDLQAADGQVAWETHRRRVKVGNPFRAEVPRRRKLFRAPGAHPQKNILWISAAQRLFGCRHSQLGCLQTLRASGLLSAAHPRPPCRAAGTHCTILSITPSPQLTEHWRKHDRALKMFQSLQKETLKQSFENKRAKSMICFLSFF